MITIDDAKAHLATVAPDAAYDDDTIAAVLGAEHAHQRSVTHVTAARPPQLDEALLRRVEVNLAETGGVAPVTRVGGRDEQVQALEADHLRRRPAEEPEPPKSRGRQRRRTTATKKAAATPKKEIS